MSWFVERKAGEYFRIEIPLSDGSKFVIFAKWDGWHYQLKHLRLHALLAFIFSPFFSIGTGFGIEGREGHVNIDKLQGFELFDFLFRTLGALSMFVTIAIILNEWKWSFFLGLWSLKF